MGGRGETVDDPVFKLTLHVSRRGLVQTCPSSRCVAQYKYDVSHVDIKIEKKERKKTSRGKERKRCFDSPRNFAAASQSTAEHTVNPQCLAQSPRTFAVAVQPGLLQQPAWP